MDEAKEDWHGLELRCKTVFTGQDSQRVSQRLWICGDFVLQLRLSFEMITPAELAGVIQRASEVVMPVEELQRGGWRDGRRFV